MKCPKCDADIQLGEKFCKSCGNSLPEEAEAPVKENDTTPAEKLLDAKVQKESHVEEKDLWQGRYSIKEAGGGWFLSAVILLAVVVVYILDLGGLKQDWFIITGAFVAGFTFLFFFFRDLKNFLTLKYRVTTQRVFFIQGFLSRTTDELEIIRVDDVQYRQSLIERIFNIGTIVVIAPTDKTHGDATRGGVGKLEMRGVKDPGNVKELIRKYCRLRREKGALFVEQV